MAGRVAEVLRLLRIVIMPGISLAFNAASASIKRASIPEASTIGSYWFFQSCEQNIGVTPSSAGTQAGSVGTRGSFAETNGSALVMTFFVPEMRSKLSATDIRATEFASVHIPFAVLFDENVMSY